MAEWISMTLWVEGPVTAAVTAMWVQGYFIITGLGVVARWLREIRHG